MEDNDRLVTFMIQFPGSRGESYGPFFYQLTAIEDNVTLAVIQGQQYTGKVCMELNYDGRNVPY